VTAKSRQALLGKIQQRVAERSAAATAELAAGTALIDSLQPPNGGSAYGSGDGGGAFAGSGGGSGGGGAVEVGSASPKSVSWIDSAEGEDELVGGGGGGGT